MEPIISPMIIYLVDFCDSLHKMGCIVGSIIGIILGLWSCFILLEDCRDNIKVYKYLWIAFIVCLVLMIFIPSKEIVTAMLTVSCITPDNISLVQDNIVDFVNKIMEAVKK